MASKGDSEQDFEEQWDDMAIVRAFEEALSEQYSRSTASVKTTNRKQRAAALQSNVNNTTRNTTIDERDEELQNGDEDLAGREGTCRQPNAGAHATGANPFASQQQQQNDLYQAAYAQAYAQLQGQFQAAYPTSNPQPYRQGMQMPVQSPYFPPPPPIPSNPTSFPGMPAAQVPGLAPNAAVPDDGLANVLMAWYQSGYYTGRFRAMQELNLRGLR
ncbi:unnamed protein product [Peronospora farinosa]|uniref:Survival motor neuron Tudor domain-containing protein n=1 Tax=Peronospora farinosa TaxID=134698 RepID=A0AAV0UU67_9STRA|nr:unnamed protein product [Peronospora farinosa]CAI5740399.1 unnamed protein product [Peronospora farinosa]